MRLKNLVPCMAAVCLLGCSGADDTTVSCTALVDRLAPQLLSASEGRPACTVVVRLSQATLRPVGYQSFCGPTANATEAQARRLAVEQMIPHVDGDRLSMMNAPAPDDAYVFYASPGDFGGIVAVSPRVGRTVFAASVVYAGVGDVLSPAQWRDPAELGARCEYGGGIPSARGYDPYDLNGNGTLTASAMAPILRAVERTALPAALGRGGTVLDAVVFPYVRSTGGLEDPAPEWVVIVNAVRPE